MKHFIANHSDKITGTLSGFDRLVFRGVLQPIAYVEGFKRLLWKHQVLLKDFGPYAQRLTNQLREASTFAAKEQGRPVQYLPSSATNKEDVAQKIARRDGITSGLIAVLSCLEPCSSYEVFRNRDTKRLELVSRLRKGLALYHYFIDPVFGFMNARIQTWLPFSIQICLNGREWLSHMMDKARLSYRRRDNCFPRLADPAKTQTLMDQQRRFPWVTALDKIARRLNPAHPAMFKDFPMHYYWTTHQSEWATDIMFKDSASLASIYPPLVLHGMTAFSSPDVMRFLGRKVHGAFKGEIVSDFKVFRPSQDRPDGPKDWRPMRKGVADLYRRTQISQASNNRYLDALSAVNTFVPLGQMIGQICRPTLWNDKPVRALRPWSQEDTQLFELVNRGEFAVKGFRNRDLQAILFTSPADSPQEKRRRSARVTRMIRMLRAHGLVKKINATHRYTLTLHGREIISAVLTTQHVTLQQLHKAAA